MKTDKKQTKTSKTRIRLWMWYLAESAFFIVPVCYGLSNGRGVWESLWLGTWIFLLLMFVSSVVILAYVYFTDEKYRRDVDMIGQRAEDTYEKRIMRENLKTWNRYNRGFIRKCEREDDTAGFDNSSADESSVIISASIATTMMSDSGDGDGD